MNRDTLEVALVEVNRRRAHHRRAIEELEARAARRLVDRRPGSTAGAVRGHVRTLERLDAAHADLAAELVILKAAQVSREAAQAVAEVYGIPIGEPIPLAGGGTLTVELPGGPLEREWNANADRPFVDPSYPAGGRVPQVDA